MHIFSLKTYMYSCNWTDNYPNKPDDNYNGGPSGGRTPNDPMTRTSPGSFGNIHVNGTLKKRIYCMHAKQYMNPLQDITNWEERCCSIVVEV